MKMKIKLGNIFCTREPLIVIFDQLEKRVAEKIRTPILFLYGIIKIAETLNPEINKIDKIRKDLIYEFGGEKIGDDLIQIPEHDVEAIKRFTEEFNKLLNAEIETDIHTIDLKLWEGIDLNIYEYGMIRFLITEEHDEAKKEPVEEKKTGKVIPFPKKKKPIKQEEGNKDDKEVS